jgi:MoxR-like ATPase
MITINDIKDKMDKIGYFAVDELVYETFNALYMFEDNKINSGQDIFAVCLEGPPGAGKTEFAKTYYKLSNMYFNNVGYVDYQCDITTGKNELFEDINISAAIRHDADKVNIPGKIIRAINLVNTGVRVVLFIDEYDKAREETDSFLLQFLQSGKINSTQHGDLEIKDEYKSNLQVILCKNDAREQLSGPLSRRLRIIRLDYMKPDIFYKVAHRNLIEDREEKVSDGLLNLVSLMYEHAYNERDYYDRLPACSEMLIAIEDADRLLKKANAPQFIIYNTIINNMFKSVDDVKTFENSIENNNEKLFELIKGMKESTVEEVMLDINKLIAEKVFATESGKYSEKVREMEQLIEKYNKLFQEMEEKRLLTINKEKDNINLQSGKLITESFMPNTIKVFEDETANIKRGYNVFNGNTNNWTNIGEVQINGLSHHYFVDEILNILSDKDYKVYENGILLKEDNDLKLIVINEFDSDSNLKFHFLISSPVTTISYIKEMYEFIMFLKDIYSKQVKTVEREVDNTLNLNNGSYKVNALIYNKNNLDLKVSDDNIYGINFDEDINNTDKLGNLVTELSKYINSDDVMGATISSDKIMKVKGRR